MDFLLILLVSFTPKATIFFFVTTVALIMAIVWYAMSERTKQQGMTTQRGRRLQTQAIISLLIFLLGYALWWLNVINLNEPK